MKRSVLLGVFAAIIGVGTASAIIFNRSRRAAAIDPEKSIDNLVDYCQTKLNQMNHLLESLPNETPKPSRVTG